ncbi:MAG: hypothetical protein JWN25_2899 [Verrucomicrobiales bacterium]|nr:hypothetical protein [Verrucomicrobiales bacterium]
MLFRMRFLFVHERFGALAGAEANAFITATELKKKGHETGIAHGPHTGKNQKGWEATFTYRKYLNSDTSNQIEQAIQEFKPDLVYVHKMADLKVIEALVSSGLPLVRMVHDHDIYCMRSYKYHYLSRKICTKSAGFGCLFPCGASIARNHGPGFPLKLISLRAKQREIALNRQFDRMVVVTQYMKEELLNNGFDSRRIEIHAPVPRMGDPNIRSNFGERNLIIYAGQIIRGKGVDILIRSLKLLKNDFQCIILGEGSHKAYCEKLALKLGLADKVKFLGFIPQEDLVNYYKECSVVAISSVWPEPFATIGLEVMRYGLPVVAFDAGGIKDWLTNGYNGYLVPWMDIKTYAEKLDSLLSDKALAKQLGLNGLELVTEKYQFDTYISSLEAMFAKIVLENSSKAVKTGQSA